MDHDEIQDALIQAITEIQVNSGRGVPKITGSTHPIGDLDGFDSLNVVEAACLLSEALDTDIKTELVLTSSFGAPLTINEMVDHVADHFNRQKGVNNGQLKFPIKSNWR